MKRAPLQYRKLARSVARDVWMRCESCGEDAKLLFEKDPRIVGIDPALVLLLVQIAMMLFEYWMKNQIDEPSVVADYSEPVDVWTEDNDAD